VNAGKISAGSDAIFIDISVKHDVVEIPASLSSLPSMQDVPSFLQEVTTVRGQIAYASAPMRSARGMPSAVSEVDEIELSQMERFMSLAEIAAVGTKLRGIADSHDSGNCTCAPLHARMMLFAVPCGSMSACTLGTLLRPRSCLLRADTCFLRALLVVFPCC
jgi:hypothetical protein